jgi:hypothetical protein
LAFTCNVGISGTLDVAPIIFYNFQIDSGTITNLSNIYIDGGQLITGNSGTTNIIMNGFTMYCGINNLVGVTSTVVGIVHLAGTTNIIFQVEGTAYFLWSTAYSRTYKFINNITFNFTGTMILRDLLVSGNIGCMLLDAGTYTYLSGILKEYDSNGLPGCNLQITAGEPLLISIK